MKLPQLILAALGLAETATEQDAVIAINSLKSEKDIALNRASNIDLNVAVPKETYQLALNRAETAEAALKAIQESEIDALVEDAIKAGKVALRTKKCSSACVVRKVALSSSRSLLKPRQRLQPTQK